MKDGSHYFGLYLDLDVTKLCLMHVLETSLLAHADKRTSAHYMYNGKTNLAKKLY